MSKHFGTVRYGWMGPKNFDHWAIGPPVRWMPPQCPHPSPKYFHVGLAVSIRWRTENVPIPPVKPICLSVVITSLVYLTHTNPQTVAIILRSKYVSYHSR